MKKENVSSKIKGRLTFDAAGNQYTYVDILKKKDDLLESIKDSVVVAPAQELVYELQF